VSAHPTAPSGIAHRRPATSPTSSIVGITHPVSGPGRRLSGTSTALEDV
jgi:hypothetical protein